MSMADFFKRTAFAMFLAAPMSLATVTAADAQSTLITGATVHTMGEAGILDDGDVLITDGVIAAVGEEVTAPEGATIIEADGKIVTPGFMTSYSSLGLVEISAVQRTRDNRADASHFSASLDVVSSLNPDSTLLPITRIEGVTRAITAQEAGPVFDGFGALIHLGDGPDIVIKERVAQFMTGGEAGAAAAGGSRPAFFAMVDESLRQVRDRQAGGVRFRVPRGGHHPVLSERDLEALGPVASGAVPLVVAVHRASDIRAVLAMKEQWTLNLVLLGVAEGWRVAEEIAAAGVPVIMDPLDNLPARFESLGARLDNAARLHAAGVTIAFTYFDTHNERLLPQAAGNAVANGLPHEAALAAMTVNPAAIWGIADSYGSLDVGKDADVVIWDGDPLEVTSAPEAVFIQGQAMDLESRQTRLRDRYRTLDGGALPFQYR